MKLKTLKIRNFRCYRNETVIAVNDLTAFIGKNDAGKSSILEALEIFFNNTIIKIEKEDLNVLANAAGENRIEITCVFGDLPAQLIIDAANPTSLIAEHLLNAAGELEVKKVYACTAATPKEQVFLVANYPTANGCQDLHQFKKAELKSRAGELGINPAAYNGNVNSSIRGAIWNHVGVLGLARVEVPVDKEDSKKIWDVLQSWMPMYALFQSDRKSKDDDKEVTDPMKVAINEALSEVEEELLIIKQKVHDKAVDVANRTLQKLQEMNPALANQLVPDFKADPKWNSIFSLTLSSDNNIPINKRGSGVRRLILLNFFRAEAERRRVKANNPSVIYAFEEPETSQHPDHQILLVDAFKDLANSVNTQVLLTTHTPALGGLLENTSLRLVTNDQHGAVVIEDGTNAAYEKIAKTLGVLPDPVASKVQLLICVEGPNDIVFIKNIVPIARQINGTIPDIVNDPRVAIFPLGGGTLKDWVTNDYLAGLEKPEFHIYDRDDNANPPYQDAANSVIGRGGNNHAVLTLKRELENYIHHDAINRTLGIAIPAYADFDDVPEIVAESLHILNGGAGVWATMDEDKRDSKMSRAKKRLNKEVVPQMTNVELQAIDPNNEIIGWFQQIGARLQT